MSSKNDFSEAYKLISHCATSAAQTIIILGLIVYIMLCFSFRGLSTLRFCAVSVRCLVIGRIKYRIQKNWNPEVLFSPSQPGTLLSDFLDKTVPFTKVQPMTVNVLTRSLGKGYRYLDDIIKVYLGLKEVIQNKSMLP